MPPKKKGGDAAGKKALQKKKEKIIEDKTFGLKNKNKSKKVQAQIESVKKNVMNSGDPKMRKMEEMRKKKKEEAKARKKAAAEERDALFGEALMAVKKKTTTKTKAGLVEAKGRDHGDDDAKAGTSRAMKMMYQMDAKEMEDKLKEDPNYVPTLEDEIEAQRQAMVEKLRKSGKKGTPVTPETFKAWQERKRRKHADEAKKTVEAELKKKKGGKGLAVLSGRDLYEYKKDLFRDDDQALDGLEEEDEGKRPALEREDDGEEKKSPEDSAMAVAVEDAAERMQSDLFLEGDDDDLDDLDDD